MNDLVQVNDDTMLIRLWLHGRPDTTTTEYKRDSGMFFDYVKLPFRAVRLADLQGWIDHLQGAPASINRRIASVKSLYTFALKVGYIQYNPCSVIKTPTLPDDLAKKIISEADIIQILANEINQRNKAILTLLYLGGLRRSEIVGLNKDDIITRDDGFQLVIFGKGNKTRHVLIGLDCGELILNQMKHDSIVFTSQLGNRLSTTQLWRIVKKACQRVGVDASPHWFRHSHASHSLDRGAPISLVSATLGHSSIATTGRYLHANPSESSGKYLIVGT